MSTKFTTAGIRKIVWKKFYLLYGCLPCHAWQDKWAISFHNISPLCEDEMQKKSEDEMQKKLVEIYMHRSIVISDGGWPINNDYGFDWSMRETLTIAGLYEHSDRVWKAMNDEGLAAVWPKPILAARVRYVSFHKPHGFSLRSIKNTPSGRKVQTNRILLPYLPYKAYQVEQLLMRMLPFQQAGQPQPDRTVLDDITV